MNYTPASAVALDSADHTVVLQYTPGEVLDERWRLDGRIGQGAMGMVFKAKDLVENRPCAVKMLAPEHVRKPKVLARFERESDLMMGLKHPNIVQLLGHGRRGPVPYLVMEYLEGQTLSELLESRGAALPLPETVAVVKRIASGLAFLHHHGLIHRDVKPQNIFLALPGRVTILDLGVVRDTANPGLTRPGAMVGTPYYMPPEQIQGLEDVDRRADVYALAALTFELLTGRPPFLGANNFEVLYGHRNTAVPDASALSKAVPKAVAQVLVCGMAKKRDERPATASEFAADLEAAAGAVSLDLAEVFKKWLKKPTRASAQARRADPETTPTPSATPNKHEKTRIVRPDRGDDVPMADNADVISVADAVDPTLPAPPKKNKRSGKTTEATIIGLDPVGGDDDETTARKTMGASEASLSQVPTAARLTIAALSRGESVEADLFVDQRPMGKTPRTVTVMPGRHHVRAELRGHHPAEKTVEAGSGSHSVKLVLVRKK